MSRVGYVIVEYNQAGGDPSLAFNGAVFYDAEEAEDCKEQREAEGRQTGRRERYAIATIETEDEE